MSNSVVFLAGLTVLSLVTTFQPMRSWLKDLLAQRYLLWTILPIFILLSWPIDYGSTFRSGMEFGWQRIVRIVLFGLIFFHLLAESARLKPNLFPRSRVLMIFGVYVFIAILSVTYSSDPLQTLWKAFELVVALLFVIRLQKGQRNSQLAVRQIANSLTYIIFSLSLMSLVGGVLAPDRAWKAFGVMGVGIRSMAGVAPQVNPNTLGQLGGILALIGFSRWMLSDKRITWGDLLVISVGLLSLFLAYSRTSIITFAGFLFLLSLMLRRVLYVVPTLTLYLIAYFFFSDRIIDYLHRGQSAEQFMSLSGRTSFWEKALNHWEKSPWLGHGFFTGHKQIAGLSPGEFLATVDSTYIETLVDLGIIGCSVLAAFAIAASYKCWQAYRYSANRSQEMLAPVLALMSFVGFIVVRSFTASSFHVLHVSLFFMLIAIVGLDLATKQQRLRKNVSDD